MQRAISLLAVILLVGITSCKKGKHTAAAECSAEAATIRAVTNKSAVIKVTGTIYGAYFVEEGSIDTKLIPCSLPKEFMQNDLQVIISGTVKQKPKADMEPCCAENIVLSDIRVR